MVESVNIVLVLISGIRMPNEIGIDDENTTKDFTNIKGVHRFRNFQIAHKLSKNLSNPTAMLHVANLPDKFTCKDLKEYLIEENFTVSDVQDCGREGNEYTCTERIVDSQPFMYNKTFLKKNSCRSL